MATCPECNRNSLEFSDVRKAAWCLHSDCEFTKPVKSHEEYIREFERPAEIVSQTGRPGPGHVGG
jgi:hypothetical protein